MKPIDQRAAKFVQGGQSTYYGANDGAPRSFGGLMRKAVLGGLAVMAVVSALGAAAPAKAAEFETNKPPFAVTEEYSVGAPDALRSAFLAYVTPRVQAGLDKIASAIEADGGRACFYIEQVPDGGEVVSASDCSAILEHNTNLEIELQKVLGMSDPHYHQQIAAADRVVHPRIQVMDRDEAIAAALNKSVDNAVIHTVTSSLN